MLVIDNEKIGQKMLEKMGWTSGKGLGVNEQGIVEHIRLNKRNPENEKAGNKDVYIFFIRMLLPDIPIISNI